MTKKTKKTTKSNHKIRPFGLKMAELLTFEVDVKNITKLVLRFFSTPRGLHLYPLTPNNPKNQTYIAIPFIYHLGDHSSLENTELLTFEVDVRFVMNEGTADEQSPI